MKLTLTLTHGKMHSELLSRKLHFSHSQALVNRITHSISVTCVYFLLFLRWKGKHIPRKWWAFFWYVICKAVFLWGKERKKKWAHSLASSKNNFLWVFYIFLHRSQTPTLNFNRSSKIQIIWASTCLFQIEIQIRASTRPFRNLPLFLSEPFLGSLAKCA